MRFCRKLLCQIRSQVLPNLSGSVVYYLLTMGKVKKSIRLVPHELTPQQSVKRFHSASWKIPLSGT
ncbi:unnamed protein product [Nezara viridula]|uniref:Uncharacterized protein n=1 Tax=Nezara viridula TaxID=85310 RepID=A0A9P0MPR2_NEZVI|nr:unnamed protein product [Nezara viridula]